MEQINIYNQDSVISCIHLSDELDALKEILTRYRKVYAVMDENVAMLSPVAAQLADFLNQTGTPGMLVEATEEGKSIRTVMNICEWLLEQGADRDALVIAVGGGITSDMVGFAASIYKRGVRFAYVPTTLLSQVDAAIGGKTGVNFNHYKNMFGVIRQPEFTFICPSFLESLSNRDFLSGAAELLKTFLIEDGGYFERAVAWLRGYALTQTQEESVEYMREQMEELSELIAAAANVKIAVVSRDQFEKGERRKLNLGHTFGHAIETLAQRKGYDITHGEAVSMGILLAAELADAYQMRSAEGGLARRLDEAFLSCGLPIGCPFRVSALADVMRKDKKASGGIVHFVLPFGIGDVQEVDFSVDDVVRLLAVK
jgi:3-dehydroquinate synthetase